MTASERQRRRRARKRDGEIVVRLTVKRQTRDVLTEARWLGDWDEDDPDALRRALQMLIDNLHTGALDPP